MATASKNTTPLQRGIFTISRINLTTAEPRRFEVSLSFPGFLYCFDSILTGRQLFSYSTFQAAVALDHSIVPYVPQIEQEACIIKRRQLWREFISSCLPELAGGAK